MLIELLTDAYVHALRLSVMSATHMVLSNLELHFA